MYKIFLKIKKFIKNIKNNNKYNKESYSEYRLSFSTACDFNK
jgi:hypothetical protein